MQLWRFPVKSMGGTPVDELRIDRRGVHADRLWAVRDLEHDITASARRAPKLLGCSARYAVDPGPDAGPGNAPEVIITMPDGTELSSAGTELDGALSELLGRKVRLTALPPLDDTSLHRLSVRQTRANYSPTEVRRDFGLSSSETLPDTSVFSTKQVLTLARYATPPGTFVDLSPVHVLSTNSLATLSAGADTADVRRFRPNVLVTLDETGTGYPEDGWVGGSVEFGSVALQVTNTTIRCVVPTRPQPGLELDRTLTRRLAECNNRFLGVYADVATAGVVRVGDAVRAHEPAPPGAMRRVTATAGRTMMRQVQRVLEATVLRE
ncbi:molybdenum cofactor biosynthesis protein [Mycolicibacterium cyprinidarum]|uniref:Molybdenum cofactor biosynthesis protein n=1 Tax=Mycolicibacterium cyprinidarum TaxID=2860311 RepID=A0ABQ4V4T4_9MYCO|nr:molybdenum cofactor biosynthesis protein [Mycolicibacterium sp. NGTWSNA01]GJF13222.1 molybdenum cofactor biosynthesis protein [Mycolicibacterium sp. NGTWS1803]GJF19084.1 molybdenum cofactor biosynthesis protein [Mycolicibacterium sp. NGTWS0302]